MGSNKIFVSHSSKDSALIELFVENILVTGLEIDPSEIFCSSLIGMRPDLGSNSAETIKAALNEASVSLFFLSENFKNSEVCLNEMGAAWVLLGEQKLIPILIPPMSFHEMGWFHSHTQAFKISDSEVLAEFKQQIAASLKLSNVRDVRWERGRRKFLEGINEVISKLDKPVVISRDEFIKTKKMLIDAENEIMELRKSNKIKNDIVENLKLTKDREQVRQILDEYSESDMAERFLEKTKKVKEIFSSVPRIVGEIYLHEKYDLELRRIDSPSSDLEEIKEAISRRFLNEEWKPTEKRVFKNLDAAIEDVQKFFKKDEFGELVEDWYQDGDVDPEIEPDNKSFWETYYW